MYARTAAFQELLGVRFPQNALQAARSEDLSVEQLQEANFRVDPYAIVRDYPRSGFCCPRDRRVFNEFCCNLGGRDRFFRKERDDSFHAHHRQRYYQMRRDHGPRCKKVQGCVWGLGNIELCCFGKSFLHKLVDSDWCLPNSCAIDEEEFVV